jgi:uncharacterized repeat protein (TIGR04138 family)
MKFNIEQIAAADGSFSAQGIAFVYEGLSYTVKKMTEESGEKTSPNHISGRDLACGLRDLAIERWGRLAKTVLNRWGIKTTRDFGEIVYLMIEHKWMSAQPSDSIDDFNDVYDFKTVFENQFEF